MQPEIVKKLMRDWQKHNRPKTVFLGKEEYDELKAYVDPEGKKKILRFKNWIIKNGN